MAVTRTSFLQCLPRGTTRIGATQGITKLRQIQCVSQCGMDITRTVEVWIDEQKTPLMLPNCKSQLLICNEGSLRGIAVRTSCKPVTICPLLVARRFLLVLWWWWWRARGRRGSSCGGRSGGGGWGERWWLSEGRVVTTARRVNHSVYQVWDG